MARGIKGTVNYDAKIKAIDEKIDGFKKKISDLQEEREGLLQKKRDIDLKELYAYMESRGMTAQEILNKIKE